MEMELELGLALPHVHVPIKKLDLKINSLKETSLDFNNTFNFNDYKGKKRTFGDAFDSECISKTTTSSLLVWDGRQPNDGKEGQRRSFHIVGKNNEKEDNQTVGWPPIKCWRKKFLHTHDHQIIMNQGCAVGRIINGRRSSSAAAAAAGAYGYNNGAVRRNSFYVKVKMEGVAIGRKIDLMLFNSYQSLINTLLNMFAKYRENDKDTDGPCSYILSYLDKEGDWLLAGDVPWQIFIETVQRIEISRTAVNGWIK